MRLSKKNVKHLTLICNVAAWPGIGTGKLFENHQVDAAICTHIGLNPIVGEQLKNGSCKIDLIPQGTFAERMRAAGAGLGGFLTPTGVGTVVQHGKQVFNIDGKEYLLELPLRADVALLCAYKSDKYGNLFFNKSSQNFQPVMAMAADLVIVEADNIVEPGDIPAECVHTPSIFVEYIVDGSKL